MPVYSTCCLFDNISIAIGRSTFSRKSKTAFHGQAKNGSVEKSNDKNNGQSNEQTFRKRFGKHCYTTIVCAMHEFCYNFFKITLQNIFSSRTFKKMLFFIRFLKQKIF